MFIPDGCGKHETLSFSYITVSLPPLSAVGQPSVPTFEKGESLKKK